MSTAEHSKVDAQLVDDLRLAVMRLDRKLRKSNDVDATPAQYSALFVLSRHGPLRLSELARREQISKSTVTRLVAQLEAKSLVRRTEDETDARSTIVALAPRGHALLADMAEGSNDYLQQRLGALTDDERKRLADAVPILTRLAERE